MPRAQTPPASTARARARRAVATEVAAEAMNLFLVQGFEATTLDQVAAAVGMSSRSVSRYFASKEDMVVGQLTEVGSDIAARLAQRPTEESPWEAMRRALDGETANFAADPDTLMATATMLAETPALRGALARKHEEWEAVLVPILTSRFGKPTRNNRLAARAVFTTMVACLTIAVEEWRITDRARTVADLLDEALLSIRTS